VPQVAVLGRDVESVHEKAVQRSTNLNLNRIIPMIPFAIHALDFWTINGKIVVWSPGISVERPFGRTAFGVRRVPHTELAGVHYLDADSATIDVLPRARGNAPSSANVPTTAK
jgi:hypothetical protein